MQTATLRLTGFKQLFLYIKSLLLKNMMGVAFECILTRVLLHVVKPPVPVQLQLHLLAHLQRGAHKVDGISPLPGHLEHRHVSYQPMVVWLEEHRLH